MRGSRGGANAPQRKNQALILCTEEELLIVVKSHFISFDFCKNVVVYFNITTCFYTDDAIGAQGGRGVCGACPGWAESGRSHCCRSE